MPRTTTQIKPKRAAKSTNTNTQQETGEIEAFPKIKKALEIEEPELIPGVTEEKLDEDGMPIPVEAEEDAETDELGLDDTEDFGDRWEE